MFWQGMAVACHQLVEPLPSIVAQRLVAGYTLAEQQSLNAICVLHPLGDQHLALAAKSAATLFIGCQRFDHSAHSRLAALIREQRAKQRHRLFPPQLQTLVRQTMQAESLRRRALCFRAKGPIDQTRVLGRHGRMPLRQATGGRRVPLAEDRRWRLTLTPARLSITHICVLNR